MLFRSGDGPYLPVLQRMVQEAALSDRVKFLGWLSVDQVKAQYARANIFLHPSRHEGMSNAVLEAMASALPIIATRISGNEDIVLEQETGLLVPVEDVEALAASLRTIIQDSPERRRAMGQAGRRRVEASFGWTQVAEQYEAMLKKAIE